MGHLLPPKLTGPGMEPKKIPLLGEGKERAYNALPYWKHPTSKWQLLNIQRKEFWKSSSSSSAAAAAAQGIEEKEKDYKPTQDQRGIDILTAPTLPPHICWGLIWAAGKTQWANYFTSSWVEVVRWGLPPHNSFLLFRTDHLLRPTHQENTWQTYLKIAATAHAQTCQNISGYDLSNIYEETEIKHVSRPPEARSKVIATATAHAQITNALQCVTRSILCTKHAKSCQDTTCQHISRINRRHQTCQ